jgi:hypothetical protein
MHTTQTTLDPRLLAASILAVDAELGMVSSEGLWQDLQARCALLCATYARVHALVGVEASEDAIVRRLWRAAVSR